MEVTVHLPSGLHALTGGDTRATTTASTVGDTIQELELRYPGIRDTLLDSKGVRRFVSICVADQDVRFLAGLDTVLKDGDELSVFLALAGG